MQSICLGSNSDFVRKWPGESVLPPSNKTNRPSQKTHHSNSPKSARLVSRSRRLKAKTFVGLKYLDLVAPLLKRLHADGCARDTAGNRSLHFDQYCMLILLYLFNPTISSLRALDQASTLDKVKKQLGYWRGHLIIYPVSSR